MESSVNEIWDFMRSRIWKDIAEELNMWQLSIVNKLCDPKETPDIETVRELQGGLKTIESMKEIDKILLNE